MIETLTASFDTGDLLTYATKFKQAKAFLSDRVGGWGGGLGACFHSLCGACQFFKDNICSLRSKC